MHTFLFIPFVVTYRSWDKNFQLLNDSYSDLAIEQRTVQITSHLSMPLQYALKSLPTPLTELPRHGAQTTPPLPFSLKPAKPLFYNYSCYLHPLLLFSYCWSPWWRVWSPGGLVLCLAQPPWWMIQFPQSPWLAPTRWLLVLTQWATRQRTNHSWEEYVYSISLITSCGYY